MSSVTSEFAQVSRRVGYFICVSGGSFGYTDVSQSTVDYNSWNITAASTTAIATNAILEDMGEIAKVNGYILRKVRNVSTIAPGGGAAFNPGSTVYTFWIVVPGGEYPMAGVASATPALSVAPVARLG